MRRRDVVKRIGVASVATAAGAGLASADDSGPTPAGEVTGIRWELEDGRVVEFTPEAFDAHPETPALSAIRDGEAYVPDCCCCGGIDCVLCFTCPDECTDFETA